MTFQIALIWKHFGAYFTYKGSFNCLALAVWICQWFFFTDSTCRSVSSFL